MLTGRWKGGWAVTSSPSMAIDLLQLTGLSRAQARTYLPDAEGDIGGPDAALTGDEGSVVWGADDLR